MKIDNRQAKKNTRRKHSNEISYFKDLNNAKELKIVLRKKPLEETFLDFKKGLKSIKTTDYNGARTVYELNSRSTLKVSFFKE